MFAKGAEDGGGTISQTTMQMILKSMGVKVDKDDMENYASEVLISVTPCNIRLEKPSKNPILEKQSGLIVTFSIHLERKI